MKNKTYKIADVLAIQALKQAVEKYGIEGTEEVINRVYTHPSMKICKEILLQMYKKLYKGQNNGHST